ncbi:MAG TPA: hypothetical protein VER11_01030 [Polyangiaceae bacterium]|nr:hypothetical protein [Polyangiaceae bacterium]
MRSIRELLPYAPFFLGVFGCTVASAADGPSATTRASLAATRTDDSQPSSHPVDEPPRPKPPREAFDACKSLTEGAACSVTFDGHGMTGICRKGPHGESELACVPQLPHGPPPSDANQSMTDTTLERKLDQLEREIRGS